MNGAALTQLVHQLDGGNVVAFFLVLTRLSPLFVLAPLFSSKMVPMRVRATVAVALAIGLTSVAAHGQHLPTAPVEVFGLLLVQFVVGLAFAFAVSAVFAAIEAAGALLDTVAGFSYGSLIDPINGNMGGALTNFYGMVAAVMFIAVGGDAWLLRGIARTFTLVPLTKSPPLTGMVTGAEAAFASIFVSALEVAAPVLVALLITDVAFGVVSKVVPQLNVFAVGFPLKVGVAVLAVGASIPFMGGFMSDQITNSVGLALHSL